MIVKTKNGYTNRLNLSEICIRRNRKEIWMYLLIRFSEASIYAFRRFYPL